MSDISKCENKKCTLKQECFRFTCKPNEFRQSYDNFKQVNGDCEYFIKDEQVRTESRKRVVQHS